MVIGYSALRVLRLAPTFSSQMTRCRVTTATLVTLETLAVGVQGVMTVTTVGLGVTVTHLSAVPRLVKHKEISCSSQYIVVDY